MARRRRSSFEVTADRLGNFATEYAGDLDASERDEIGRVIYVLDQFASGERPDDALRSWSIGTER